MDENAEKRLKMAIKHLALNQTKLAEAVGIKQSTLSEALSKGRISQEVAEYIGKTYNINLNWLYLNKGDMYYKKEAPASEDHINELKDMALALTRAKMKIEKLEEQLKYYTDRDQRSS